MGTVYIAMHEKMGWGRSDKMVEAATRALDNGGKEPSKLSVTEVINPTMTDLELLPKVGVDQMGNITAPEKSQFRPLKLVDDKALLMMYAEFHAGLDDKVN
jgi:hypothetical protein